MRVQYIKYTNEYNLKLQIHQHSLLTRKVFSRHKLSAQVFFSVSSRSSSSSCHIQVIFIWIWIITRYGSSSLDLDHHSIWIIIIGYGSSLNMDHHHWTGSGSSLDLDHLWFWNISDGLSSQVLSLDSSPHRKFYRANPFSCWL